MTAIKRIPSPLTKYVVRLSTSLISKIETDGVLGIHGRPFKVWQDAQGIPGKEGGYCPHQNGLFLAWHRPYLALYEVGISHVFDLPLPLQFSYSVGRVLTYQ